MNNKPTTQPSSYSLQQWIQKVELQFQKQQQELNELKQTVLILQQQLTEQQSSAQAAPIYHVDKIEYRFDQLKVDTLEGALHIGMSACDPSLKPTHIEELIIDKQVNTNFQYKKPNEQPTTKPSNQSIVESYSNEALQKYMLENAPNSIQRIAKQLQVQVDEEHTDRIINDIGQQLSDRIRYYTSEILLSDEHSMRNGTASKDNIEEAKQAVVMKTKRDVEIAIDQYLQAMIKT